MCLASFFVSCKYGNAELSFVYIQFDTHDGGFIVSFPTSLIGEAGSTGLHRLLTLSGFDPVMSQLGFKLSAKIDWVHYVDDELSMLAYNFETEAVSDVVTTRVPECSKVSGEVVLEVPSCELAWLKGTSYASS